MGVERGHATWRATRRGHELSGMRIVRRCKACQEGIGDPRGLGEEDKADGEPCILVERRRPCSGGRNNSNSSQSAVRCRAGWSCLWRQVALGTTALSPIQPPWPKTRTGQTAAQQPHACPAQRGNQHSPTVHPLQHTTALDSGSQAAPYSAIQRLLHNSMTPGLQGCVHHCMQMHKFDKHMDPSRIQHHHHLGPRSVDTMRT